MTPLDPRAFTIANVMARLENMPIDPMQRGLGRAAISIALKRLGARLQRLGGLGWSGQFPWRKGPAPTQWVCCRGWAGRAYGRYAQKHGVGGVLGFSAKT